MLVALCPFSRFVHVVWGQRPRACLGRDGDPQQLGAHVLRGEQLFGRALATERDGDQRRPGRETETELWGHRKGHSYTASESCRPTAQSRVVSEGDGHSHSGRLIREPKPAL